MRRRTVRIAGAACVALLLATLPVAAQIEEHPGYFPVDRFEILADDDLSLEINLNRGLLQLVAAALGSEEPEFAELVGALESIRVRVAPVESLDVRDVRSRLSEATDWLEGHNWSTMLRLRESGEEVYVYTRLEGGEMQGLALLSLEEGGEAVLVNVVGSLAPERLAGLAEALDIPQLGLAIGMGADDGASGNGEERR